MFSPALPLRSSRRSRTCAPSAARSARGDHPGCAAAKIAGEAAIISASALAAYGYGLARYGLGPRAGTLAFTSLVAGQLLHAWTCRSERHGVFTPEALPRRYLDAAVLGSLGLQAAALLIPGLRGLLGLGRLSLMDGLVADQGGIVPFAINELRKLQRQDAAAQVQRARSNRRPLCGRQPTALTNAMAARGSTLSTTRSARNCATASAIPSGVRSPSGPWKLFGTILERASGIEVMTPLVNSKPRICAAFTCALS